MRGGDISTTISSTPPIIQNPPGRVYLIAIEHTSADLPVGTGEQEELIDIQADKTAKTKHKECSPLNFWVSMASSYPTLARHAVPQLLIFPSTWECEQGFSAFMAIKSKSWNPLAAPGHDFRCAVVRGDCTGPPSGTRSQNG
ncbi:zinc finger BED domain-containing protein 5-like [Palaemon carinicauda]|uniref:zinc finger BED domain-containing protein 5-like n=1 Tax=Palaemon carinicauda TaxID=392227 RepID=UPI0035B5DE30